MIVTLAMLKEAQPNWFSPENKRFFGDVSYKVLYSKIGKKPYLVRSTYAWSDMFGKPKQLTYRINPINTDNFKIEPLTDDVFKTLDDVKDWLGEAESMVDDTFKTLDGQRKEVK